jgi:hypothetical protein
MRGAVSLVPYFQGAGKNVGVPAEECLVQTEEMIRGMIRRMTNAILSQETPTIRVTSNEEGSLGQEMLVRRRNALKVCLVDRNPAERNDEKSDAMSVKKNVEMHNVRMSVEKNVKMSVARTNLVIEEHVPRIHVNSKHGRVKGSRTSLLKQRRVKVINCLVG